MIITSLLKLIMFILNTLAGIFGSIVPSFPDDVVAILDTIASMLSGGISFISYFFFWPIVVGLISLVIAWHYFQVGKDLVMKVIGHFIAN